MNEYLNPSLAETLLISLVGFLVVFSVLIILMGIITVMSKMVGGAKKAAPAPVTASAPATAAPAAPAGVVLENISEKEAAMVMAIVADEMKKDPAQLRFISIKEVKE